MGEDGRDTSILAGKPVDPQLSPDELGGLGVEHRGIAEDQREKYDGPEIDKIVKALEDTGINIERILELFPYLDARLNSILAKADKSEEEQS